MIPERILDRDESRFTVPRLQFCYSRLRLVSGKVRMPADQARHLKGELIHQPVGCHLGHAPRVACPLDRHLPGAVFPAWANEHIGGIVDVLLERLHSSRENSKSSVKTLCAITAMAFLGALGVQVGAADSVLDLIFGTVGSDDFQDFRLGFPDEGIAYRNSAPAQGTKEPFKKNEAKWMGRARCCGPYHRPGDRQVLTDHAILVEADRRNLQGASDRVSQTREE